MATILVVDPSPSIRETLRIVLDVEHAVVTADDVDAVEVVARPALVLLGLPPVRDDDAIARGLARAAAGVPLLFLHRPGDVDLRRLVPPGVPVAFLPKPFDARGLRDAVRTMLAPVDDACSTADVDRLRRYLEYPFLSGGAAHVARLATTSDLPVLVAGEAGSCALTIAHAIHACSRAPGVVVAVDARTPPSPALPGAAGDTLFVDGVEDIPPGRQLELLSLVRDPLGTGPRPRVIAATTVDLAEEAAAGRFLPELAYALTTCVLPITPLRDRVDELPELVTAVTTSLVRRLRLEPVRYTDAALERLRRYVWFGNLAELEAVLARTLLLRRPRVVEADDLVFVPARTLAAVAEAVPRTARAEPPPIAASLPGPNLEVLLGELAHELRNPMVTIKTFAQHIESVLADPDVRTRFSTLTADAVTRMDRLLETLLDFARFRAPAPHPLDLGVLVDRVVGEQADELARKDVRVERDGGAPPGLRVDVDEPQLLFALRQLFAGLVGDVVPHAPLTLALRAEGTLAIGLRTERTVAERLAAFVDGTKDGDTPPLYVVLAAALVQRNRGALRVEAGPEGTSIVTVALPPAVEVADAGAA